MLKSQDVRRFQERLKAERDAIESRIASNKHGIQETVQDESGVGDSGDDQTSFTSEKQRSTKMPGIRRNWRKSRERSTASNKDLRG